MTFFFAGTLKKHCRITERSLTATNHAHHFGTARIIFASQKSFKENYRFIFWRNFTAKRFFKKELEKLKLA